MIDFGLVRAGELDLGAFATGLTRLDLAQGTRAITAELLAELGPAGDAEVTFVPLDPAADDTFADDPSEAGLAWTLGHVIVHLTASAEEAAFLAAELARGVENHGRSRYEVPWSTLTTIAACRARLVESQRMILASLETWPDVPHLEVVYTTSSGATRTAVARFLGGLRHSDEHVGQVRESLRQARAARIAGR